MVCGSCWLDLQGRVHVEGVVGGDHGRLPLTAAQAGRRHARLQHLHGFSTGLMSDLGAPAQLSYEITARGSGHVSLRPVTRACSDADVET